jgi:hypothetical protein
MDPEILAKLRAPFPPESIGHKPTITCRACSNKDTKCEQHKARNCGQCKQFVTTAHMHLDFVGHAYVRERLLDVDPEWNWKPLALNAQGLPAMDDNGGMWIELTVGGVTRLGYGDAPGKRGGNAVKEVIGDALRNAGQSFGIALEMWKKEAASVAEDVPERQVERPRQQTEEERRTELRGQIAAIGKKAGKTVEQVAADFAEWSRGTDIRAASVAVLVEYKDHLQRAAQA